MPPVPVPADPGRGASRPGAQSEPEYWEPVITRPDPLSLEEWLASDPGSDEPPPDGDGYLDPDSDELP
jgi:hypothetical protein